MKWLRNISRGRSQIKGIDHLAVVVSDMDRSIEFYTSILKMDLIKDGRPEGGLKKSFIGVGKKTLIALTEDKNRSLAPAGRVEGVDHVAFYVDDIGKAGGYLKEKGVRIIEEKADKEGRTTAYHFLDPDGLELEICVETGRETPQY
ncbi:MAG TPA: VOC family protein [Thermodesulfobacteriota bacterium]|nr:VOC family protein [Thermodesulfobacteriota bacterium]